METIYKEIWIRFPEVRESLQDNDPHLPYVAMGVLACWLQELQPSELVPDLVQRIVDFVDWCKDQPPGNTAEDDTYTIMIVAFFEGMFELDITRMLIPKLISKEELIEAGKYLKVWVGITNYEMALRLYN